MSYRNSAGRLIEPNVHYVGDACEGGHACECDHGETDGPCGAPAMTRHRHHPWYARHPLVQPQAPPTYLRLCEPCNDECHNRENERWA